MSSSSRFSSTGIPAFDDMLGGGLLPGKLTVVLGATGIGKTQLGLHFAQRGMEQEGQPGILFDMTSRGDAQNHADYARRMFGWDLQERSIEQSLAPEELWDAKLARADYCHLFERSGRRVTLADLDHDAWQEWKAELNRKLERAVAFFYANFAHGVRRCVIDGIEPTDRASDSFQFHVFNYVYHQILHKDADWVARDVFRVSFRAQEPRVVQHLYDHRQIACVLLATSHEVMLDDLLSRPIESGDELSNANTVILMGKIREGSKMKRALYIAKHRGSACDDSIVPFEISNRGITICR